MERSPLILSPAQRPDPEPGYRRVRMKVAGYLNHPQGAEVDFYQTEAAILVKRDWAVYIDEHLQKPAEEAKPAPTPVAAPVAVAEAPKAAKAPKSKAEKAEVKP